MWISGLRLLVIISASAAGYRRRGMRDCRPNSVTVHMALEEIVGVVNRVFSTETATARHISTRWKRRRTRLAIFPVLLLSAVNFVCANASPVILISAVGPKLTKDQSHPSIHRKILDNYITPMRDADSFPTTDSAGSFSSSTNTSTTKPSVTDTPTASQMGLRNDNDTDSEVALARPTSLPERVDRLTRGPGKWSSRRGKCKPRLYLTPLNLSGCNRTYQTLSGCHGNCYSLITPLPTHVEPGDAKVSYSLSCSCCKPIGWTEIKVKLRCREGLKTIKVKSANGCECSRCGNVSL